jgi:hypothetical protein
MSTFLSLWTLWAWDRASAENLVFPPQNNTIRLLGIIFLHTVLWMSSGVIVVSAFKSLHQVSIKFTFIEPFNSTMYLYTIYYICIPMPAKQEYLYRSIYTNSNVGVTPCRATPRGHIRTDPKCVSRGVTRVARWFVFKPKIPIWVKFRRSSYEKSWHILWQFRLFYGHWKYFRPFDTFCGTLV